VESVDFIIEWSMCSEFSFLVILSAWEGLALGNITFVKIVGSLESMELWTVF
jgi:hypothetical protein